MKTMTRIGMLGLLFLVVTPLAVADSIVLFEDEQTKWTAEWHDDLFNLQFDASTSVGQVMGTLIKTGSFLANETFSITFTQTKKDVTKAGSQLRFWLKEDLTNASTFDWVGFNWSLADENPNTQRQSGAHAGFAHFHPGSGTAGADSVFKVAPFTVTNAFNNTNSLSARSGGRVAPGDHYKPQGITVHEIDYFESSPAQDAAKGYARQFTLNESPILAPEPSYTVTLIGGMLAIALRLRGGKSRL